MHVEDIVNAHWLKYGRNFYCRYDYEGVESSAANKLMSQLIANFASLVGTKYATDRYEIRSADEFEYVDPIDGSVSSHQGIRLLFVCGSRIVFRLSGTAGSGATIRMYLEQYSKNPNEYINTREALREIVTIALQVSNLVAITGMESPTVIT